MSGVLLAVSFLGGIAGCGPTSPGDQPSHHSSIAPNAPSGVPTGSDTDEALTSQTQRVVPSPPIPAISVRPEKPIAGEDQKATKPVNQEAQERLKDLESWARQGFPGGNEPMIRALNDPDERVRARAQELVAGDWSAPIGAAYQTPQ